MQLLLQLLCNLGSQADAGGGGHLPLPDRVTAELGADLSCEAATAWLQQ